MKHKNQPALQHGPETEVDFRLPGLKKHEAISEATHLYLIENAAVQLVDNIPEPITAVTPQSEEYYGQQAA